MRRIIGKFLMGAAVFLGISTGQVWAEMATKEFSTEIVSQSQGQNARGKLYVGKDKARVEIMETVAITRLDQKVSWVLMPAQQMYMEQPIDPKTMASTSTIFPGEIERTSLGREPVAGQPAEKFRVSYSEGGTTQTVFQWIGKEEIPLKITSEDGSWSVEYQNIRVGAQPASLFEIPAGYQKFEMPAMPSTDNLQEMMSQASSKGEY